MLDPVIEFFTFVFHKIGQGIGWVIAAILWPFVAFGRWYNKRGWIIKGPIGLLLLALVFGYAFFFYHTQFWRGFDPDYARAYRPDAAAVSAGAASSMVASSTDTSGATSAEPSSGGKCQPSRMVQASVDLIDFNVNQNAWVPSMFMSKLGFFGMDWKKTPFMDNKAAFQLGTLTALRRTSVELVDRLGRVRGTSGIDQNLQDARQFMAYSEDRWYFSLDPFGPHSTSQATFKAGMRSLVKFNEELSACRSNFDARPDNLLQFLDRVTSDIGSTSDILRKRMEASNAGWFDPRADDRFWFAYGQLYAYSGILTAARGDFADVIKTRSLEQIWLRTEEQLRAALGMMPAVISNGNESSWIMPTHLATMGFYVLRIRSNLVETRDVLDR